MKAKPLLVKEWLLKLDKIPDIMYIIFVANRVMLALYQFKDDEE